MATLAFEIPDAIAQRVIDGVAGQNEYRDTVEDSKGKVIPNPESKNQFVKRMIREYIKGNVKAWETSQAIATARQGTSDRVDSEVTIT